MSLSAELVQAVQAQDLVSATSLIKKGGCINAKDKDGNSVLHLAASNGDFDMVKLLVENGAEVLTKNSLGNTPREVARASRGNGVVLSDDSFNRMLGIPTGDDLDRKHADLLNYLAQKEKLAIAAMEEKERTISAKTRQSINHLKSKIDKNKYKLR
jgi:hypothetical protein